MIIVELVKVATLNFLKFVMSFAGCVEGLLTKSMEDDQLIPTIRCTRRLVPFVSLV
jgi:hypothetical protein